MKNFLIATVVSIHASATRVCNQNEPEVHQHPRLRNTWKHAAGVNPARPMQKKKPQPMAKTVTHKMTEQVFVCPVVPGRCESWACSVKTSFDDDDKMTGAWEIFNDGVLHCEWGKSTHHVSGVVQFRQPLSQPRVIHAIRKLFPVGDIAVEESTGIKQISRAVRLAKELRRSDMTQRCDI